MVKFLDITDDLEFDKYDLVYMGSGNYENQELIIKHLLKYKKDIKKCVENRKFFIITGNTLDIFGSHIISKGKKIKSLNLFDYYVKIEDINFADRSLFKCKLIDEEIIGYQKQNSLMFNNKYSLFQVIEGIGENINSLSEGQELVLSASVLEGTGLEDINAIAIAFNAIADNLKTAKINLNTDGLDADKVKLINDLTAALKNYDSANPDGTQRNVTLNVTGAEDADKWVKNLYDNLTQLDEAKEFNSALNLTVNLTDGKGNTVSYVDSYSNLLTENAQLIEDNAALSGTVSDLTTIADSQKA
jgi:CobQ-like glutamine amidotransferase family enzyme